MTAFWGATGSYLSAVHLQVEHASGGRRISTPAECCWGGRCHLPPSEFPAWERCTLSSSIYLQRHLPTFTAYRMESCCTGVYGRYTLLHTATLPEGGASARCTACLAPATRLVTAATRVQVIFYRV